MARRVTTPVAAEYLGFAEVTLKTSRITDKLGDREAPPHFKIGRKVFYDLDDLDAYIASCRVVPTTEPVSAAT